MKLNHKLIVASTFLTLLSANVITPTSVFASEVQHTINTEKEKTNLNYMLTNKEVTTWLEDARIFTINMIRYNENLLHSPHVYFDNIPLGNHKDLPDKLNSHQEKARSHALYWYNNIEKNLFNSFENTIQWHVKINNNYGRIECAIKNKNIDDLKKGLLNLGEHANLNRAVAQKILDDLKKFRKDVSEDIRNFKGDVQILEGILQSTQIEIDLEKALIEDVVRKMRDSNETASELVKLDKILKWFTTVHRGAYIVNGIYYQNLYAKMENLNKNLNDEVENYRKVKVTVEYLENMKKVINQAINALQYMTERWGDIDKTYKTITEELEEMNEKVQNESFIFLLANLKTVRAYEDPLITKITTIRTEIEKTKKKYDQKLLLDEILSSIR
ncbi:HBL/NHE enterotoxin family protein [Bacillus sp. AR18-7]|uniref:HBL/NHE enterotoxin family protein n=1 Tax=Bacillus sp. AR18-7 TaxID=2217821 RepID=UPI0015D44DD2|nr:HBL/NHE enterotoxin family protein [Bacillus sp. AR18-7]